MKLEFSRQIFEKYSNIKFHENPSSGSRGVSCGRTDRHRQTDMKKLTVAFRSSANAPKNSKHKENIRRRLDLLPAETHPVCEGWKNGVYLKICWFTRCRCYIRQRKTWPCDFPSTKQCSLPDQTGLGSETHFVVTRNVNVLTETGNARFVLGKVAFLSSGTCHAQECDSLYTSVSNDRMW